MIACVKRMLAKDYKAALSADMSSDSDISLSDPTKCFVITDFGKENCNGQWLMSLVQAPHLKKPVFGAPERVYIFDKKSRFDRMRYCDY